MVQKNGIFLAVLGHPMWPNNFVPGHNSQAKKERATFPSELSNLGTLKTAKLCSSAIWRPFPYLSRWPARIYKSNVWFLTHIVENEFLGFVGNTIYVIFKTPDFGCCNNCPRDNSPRRQLSKGLLSNDTVVQGDYFPRRLLSKEAFTIKKLDLISYWIVP